jgi:AraC-like DNA-binding protein
MAIPVTTVAMVLRYTRQLQSMGAPVGRLLRQARIPADLLNYPAAAVPLENAFRFGELACRTQSNEHLGLQVGLATSLDDLGPYGHLLQKALTVHDYLRKGIALYNRLNTGQRLWISEHGEELRLNIASFGGSELAAYQSHIETLVVTIAKLREAAGPDWAPREISLAYRTREDLPAIDLFAGSRILRGTGQTYITIPRAMMGLRFPGDRDIPAGKPESLAGRPLPEDLAGLVQLQIGCLLPDRASKIDFVAETLAMSVRSLQRGLASQGLTYSQLLAETRMRRATKWLADADKPIAEIAFDLGYTDPSNFTRAFRRHAGVSPQTLRDAAKKT